MLIGVCKSILNLFIIVLNKHSYILCITLYLQTFWLHVSVINLNICERNSYMISLFEAISFRYVHKSDLIQNQCPWLFRKQMTWIQILNNHRFDRLVYVSIDVAHYAQVWISFSHLSRKLFKVSFHNGIRQCKTNMSVKKQHCILIYTNVTCK